MQRFFSRDIAPATTGLGHLLRSAREARFISLAQASHELNLQLQYLEALEQNDFGRLPAGSYGRYFTEEYARYLGVDVPEAVAAYQTQAQTVRRAAPSQGLERTGRDLVANHPLRRLLLVFGVIVVVAYLSVAAWVTLRPPLLVLTTPSSDATTIVPDIRIAGYTRPGTEVQVNGQEVQVADDGSFVLEVSLQPGINVLTVRASKTYAQPVMVERRMLYGPRERPSSEHTPEEQNVIE